MKLSISLVTLIGLVGVAHGDRDKDKADSLFKQGKKWMGEKRYADACQAFEQSFKLDPGIGGELNVARCYEEWGKLARAYHAYEKAEQMAKDAHDNRESKIHELVVQLDAQVPRLTIKLPKGTSTDGLTVTIDNNPVVNKTLGEPQMVDPGPHLIEYQVTGGAKKNKIVPVERGGASEISLDVPKGKAGGKDGENEPTPAVTARDPGRTQKLVGLAVGGAGIVAIGVSSYMTLSARSKYKTALANDCGGVTNGCSAVGLTETHDARHEANVATVVFSLGLAAVGGGVALYLLAPHGKAAERDPEALYLVPSVGPDGGGLVFGGRY